MSETEIIKHVWNSLHKSWHFAAPNICMFVWESDILAVTKSGYSVEYEVKRTRADFKCDAKKLGHYEYADANNPRGKTYTKYESLQMGKGPNRFYYVLPDGVVNAEEIPEWAGIIRFDEHGLSVTRDAKLLHKEKFPERRILQMCRSLYYRTFNKL